MKGRLLPRLIFLVYPRRFRSIFGTEALRQLEDDLNEATAPGGWRGIAGYAANIFDFALAGILERTSRQRVSADTNRLGSIGDGQQSALRAPRLTDTLMQDVRYGLRTLGRSPGFTAVAVLILALGCGANTSMFSILSTLFLQRPPSVAAPEELVRFTWVGEDGEVGDSHPYPDYEYYRDNNDVFSGVLAYRFSKTVMAVGNGEQISSARVGFVSGEYFDVLGVHMIEGRGFLPEENVTPGSHPVVVLGNGYWKQHFGSDPTIVGRSIALDGNAFTVVGVTPDGFRGISPVEEPPDLFLPAMMRGFGLRRTDGQFSSSWTVVGRLRAGVSLSVAQSNISVLADRYKDVFAAWIDATSPPPRHIVLTSRFQLSSRTGVRLGRLLVPLFLVAAMVLLIACTNVALLLLARASARQCEIGIRRALGAGQSRVIRQLMTESVLLAVAGGLGGYLVAFWGAEFAGALIPFSFTVEFVPDWRVLLFTLVLSAGATVLFGLTPAILASKGRIVSSIHQGRQLGQRRTLRDTLVVLQLATSMVLLTGTGLFLRSLLFAQNMDLGFEVNRTLLVSVPLQRAGYNDETGRQFLREVSDRIRSLPGVTAMSIALNTPFAGRWSENIEVPNTEPAGSTPEVGFNIVGEDYFSLMGIPLVAGREFTTTDEEETEPVVIVNETTAARLWADQNALGKAIRWNRQDWTVIGIVRDAVYYDIGEAPQTQVYLSADQNPSLIPTLMIVSSLDLIDLTRSVRRIIREQDPNVLVYRATTLGALVSDQYGQYRVLATLMAMFGGLALLLAVVGLYGVQAYLVAQRSREIGIRMALGAPAGDLAFAVIGRGAVLALIGIAVGLGAAFALARMVQSMLFGISATDPLSFASAPLILLGVTIVASLLPARRASRVNPVEALRAE